MFHLCRQWLLVSLLIFSLGGKWVTLQSVAWARMLVRYAQSESLPEAVRMTFDGQHPCPLCHAVRKGQQEERRQERSSPVPAKTDFDLPLRRLHPPAPAQQPITAFSSPRDPLSRRADPPPKPPPRCV